VSFIAVNPEVFMGNDRDIITILTEIRDNQREEIAWRKKVLEESLRLQRAGLRGQRLAMTIGGLLIFAGVSAVVFAVFVGVFASRFFGG
jgi:hypothetical protein